MKKRILAVLLLAGLMLAVTACDPGRSKYEIVTNEQGEAVTDEKGDAVTKEKDENKEKNNGNGIQIATDNGNYGAMIPGRK